MPRATEVAEVAVNGQRYGNWDTVSVTRSGQDLIPRFNFSAASPLESSPNWAGMKLGIGSDCQVYLAGRKVVDGKILTRQVAYNAQQHGLEVGGASRINTITRATVDHEQQSEFKNSSLSQVANALLQKFNIKFSLKGSTDGADKPFEKVSVQPGETVFQAIERLCRMRNIYMIPGMDENILGYRLGDASGAVADLQEGRNILSCSVAENYEGAFSEISAVGQQPRNDDHNGDAARDVKAKVTNSSVPEHAPLIIMAEMPGDQTDMKMRAQHENGENIATQINAQIEVQGWFKDDDTLWLEHVGDPVTIYSPMAFTNDRMTLAIQDVVSTQSAGGTKTTLTLVLPERFNGGGQISGATGGSAAVPGVSSGGGVSV